MTGFHHRANRAHRHLAHAAPSALRAPRRISHPDRSPLQGFVYAVPLGLVMWAVIGGAIALF